MIEKYKNYISDSKFKEINCITNHSVINELLLYLFIFASIILTRDTLITTIKVGIRNSSIAYIILVAVLLILTLITNKKSLVLRIDSIAFCGALTLISIVTTLIKLDFQPFLVAIILCYAYALFTLHIFTLESFYSKFSNIILALATYSLFTHYILRPFLFVGNSPSQLVPIIYNSSKIAFFDFKFSFVLARHDYYRNFGLFREPGVYQFFLSLALIYECLLNQNKKRWIHIILLSLTILSTFSLPGFLSLFLIFVIFALNALPKMNFRKNMIIFAFISILIVTVVYIYFSNNNIVKITVIEMFKKISLNNVSSNVRLNSIINEITLFLRHPLIGTTYNNIMVLKGYSANSYFSILAHFGFLAGVMLVISQILFSKLISDKLLSRILAFILFFILAGTQYLLTNPLFWILIFTPLFKVSNRNP